MRAGQWVENVRIAGLDLRDFRGRAVFMTGVKGCIVAHCDLRKAEVGWGVAFDLREATLPGRNELLVEVTSTVGHLLVPAAASLVGLLAVRLGNPAHTSATPSGSRHRRCEYSEDFRRS